MDSDVTPGLATSQGSAARRRIVDASFELFAERGIRAVGVDELIARASVAKATFYSHFRSKEDLVLAYLERLYQARAAAVESAVQRGGGGPHALLGILDAFSEAFEPGVNDGNSMAHVIIEMGPDHPLARASMDYLERMCSQFERLAAEAGLRDAEEFARMIQILIQGTVVSAARGDLSAGRHAREIMGALIELHSRGQSAV